MLKTAKHWWKKSKKIYLNREKYYVYETEDSVQYQFSPISSIHSRSSQPKSQQPLFVAIAKLILNFILRSKETRIAKTILKNKKVWKLTLHDLETDDKDVVTNTVHGFGERINTNVNGTEQGFQKKTGANLANFILNTDAKITKPRKDSLHNKRC